MPFLSCEGDPSDPDDEDECDKIVTICDANSHVCKVLCMYREDGLKVIEVWGRVERLDLSVADALKMFTTIGNAGVGLTNEGMKLPRVMQNVVKEVEANLGKNTDQGSDLAGGGLTSIAGIVRAKIEIKRQEYGIKIIDRKLAANGCAPCKSSTPTSKRKP